MNSTALAVFAYRRPSHLLRVLRSLQVQLQQISLPVHLFLDGPRGNDDVSAVQACRNVVEKFTTDMDIHLNQSSVNRGLYLSITEGVSLVLGQYSQAIVLEEDILTSPYFLRYMLDGLSRYADEPRVASIHGYVPPIPAELSDTFFLRGADCWGWATWRDRWSLYRHDAAAMASEIRSRGLARAFDLGGHVPNLRLLDARAAGRSSSWQSAGMPAVSWPNASPSIQVVPWCAISVWIILVSTALLLHHSKPCSRIVHWLSACRRLRRIQQSLPHLLASSLRPPYRFVC